MAEYYLAKVDVASSNLVFSSNLRYTNRKVGVNMNDIKVPDEWPRHKKVKFHIVSVALLVLFLLFNI